MKPARYQHDCNDCEFLGLHEEFDLYYCRRCDGGSVIARYSSVGSNYCSSPVYLLLRRAIGELAFNDKQEAVDPLFVAVWKLVDRDKIKITVSYVEK